MICVEICLGSSCFTRGNRETLNLLEDHITEQNLAEKVTLKGRLCLDRCSCGPHIMVDGVRHELMAPEGAIEILTSVIADSAPDGGTE